MWIWKNLRSNEHYLRSSEKKAWKKFRPVRDLNHDLCDTGAVLYQATRELVTVLVSNKLVKWWINSCEYMEVIYLNCVNMEAIFAAMNTT